MKAWSALLRQRREKLQLTQTELAVQVGVSLPSIQNMEAGRANPSLKTLEKVFAGLDVEIVFHVIDEKMSEKRHAAVQKTSDKSREVENLTANTISKPGTQSNAKQDLGEVIRDLGTEFSDLRHGTAVERAEKLVKIFGKITKR